ncbi:hypothetical protein ACWCZ5_33700 [Streptomyces sp. NPDC001667]
MEIRRVETARQQLRSRTGGGPGSGTGATSSRNTGVADTASGPSATPAAAAAMAYR